MTTRPRSSLALSGEQAQAALAVLIQEGRLKAGDVQKALQRRDRLIQALRASLAALETGVGRVRGSLPMARKVGSVKRKAARRKPRISAATRKMYRLQGKYLSVLRPLTKQARAKVKAIREKSGVRTAIAAAKRMAK